jgi:hypothetical protein
VTSITTETRSPGGSDGRSIPSLHRGRSGFRPSASDEVPDPHENLEAIGLEFIDERRWKVSCAIAAKIFGKKSTAAEHIEGSTGRTELATMRRKITIFAMLASLFATWHVVHWVAGLIVTEYGMLGGLVACGVIYVTSLIMDHYGL